MARSKTQQKKTNAKTKLVENQNASEIPLRHKFNYVKAGIGFVIVLVVGLLILQAASKKMQNTANQQTLISPIPSEISQNSSTTPSSIVTKTVPTTSQKASTEGAVKITKDAIPGTIVKVLPFTKGEPFAYTIRKGDSFAKIGQKFCNEPREYLYLMDKNPHAVRNGLHAGETINISCEK